jgi:hypothetical protein
MCRLSRAHVARRCCHCVLPLMWQHRGSCLGDLSGAVCQATRAAFAPWPARSADGPTEKASWILRIRGRVDAHAGCGYRCGGECLHLFLWLLLLAVWLCGLIRALLARGLNPLFLVMSGQYVWPVRSTCYRAQPVLCLLHSYHEAVLAGTGCPPPSVSCGCVVAPCVCQAAVVALGLSSQP